ncbi:hypothetical protein J3F83DRAFT_30858 [Trichoderma novae-zelandiae]
MSGPAPRFSISRPGEGRRAQCRHTGTSTSHSSPSPCFLSERIRGAHLLAELLVPLLLLVLVLLLGGDRRLTWGAPNPLQQPWLLLPVILLGWSPPPGCSEPCGGPLFRGSILILQFTRGRGRSMQPWLCSLGLAWCLLPHPLSKRYSSSAMHQRSGTTGFTVRTTCSSTLLWSLYILSLDTVPRNGRAGAQCLSSLSSTAVARLVVWRMNHLSLIDLISSNPNSPA